MSNAPSDTATPMNAATIDALRSHIDQIDDQIQDLLVARFALVERIGMLKTDGGLALRPGREAEILRRLAARHQASFPKTTVLRIWREILGGTTNHQSPLTIAVTQSEQSRGFTELARNHFGSVTPIQTVAGAGQVVRMVAEDRTPVGIVPLPGDAAEGSPDTWWISLVADNAPRIVTRLPFFPIDMQDPVEGFVIAKRPHDRTGADRTLMVLETTAAISRDMMRALLAKADFEPTETAASARMGDTLFHLVEVESWVATGDTRLNALVRDQIKHAAIVGGYPIPLS